MSHLLLFSGLESEVRSINPAVIPNAVRNLRLSFGSSSINLSLFASTVYSETHSRKNNRRSFVAALLRMTEHFDRNFRLITLDAAPLQGRGRFLRPAAVPSWSRTSRLPGRVSLPLA